MIVSTRSVFLQALQAGVSDAAFLRDVLGAVSATDANRTYGASLLPESEREREREMMINM